MSGYTLSVIREALAAQLRANLDRATTVAAYEDGKVMPAPSITVVADPSSYVDYFATFGSLGIGIVRFRLKLDAFVGTNVESAHRRRDDYLSCGNGNTSSIVDALMADPSLGLPGVNVGVDGATVNDDDVTAEIALEVHVNKNGATV